jgi:HlyD family secretion protein
MKKTVTVIVLILIVAIFGFSIFYLYQKEQEPPVKFATESPSVETIVKETVATGTIIPREEVPVKPNISGIIDKLFVKAGDTVKAGQLVAQLKVVPNVANLNNAKNQIRTANINLENEKKIYNRQKELFEKGVISANDFDLAQRSYDIAKQNLKAAEDTYEIVKNGTIEGIGDAATTEIKATVSGMILDVPVKVGNQVIEANNFNEGTTLVTIANTNDMIFQGKIDESEVGKIKEGLPLEITIGALEGKKFDAILDYIAPQGVEENGAVQFEIEGTLKERKEAVFIRAGLSANASIILEKAEEVLAIKESLVQFDEDSKKPFVEVQVGDQKFDRKEIELGISDGINVEVKKGLSKDDKIKVWNKTKETFDQKGRRG